MNGIEMMLKSFGLDPVKLKAQLSEAQQVLTQKVEAIDTELGVIRASLLRIEIKLGTLPQEEMKKLLADNEQTAIAELERLYGRNNHDDSNRNDRDGCSAD